MSTLTISVDPDVLKRARMRALERGESVNKYLSRALERYADADRSDVALGLLALADGVDASSGTDGRGWRREDLYDV